VPKTRHNTLPDGTKKTGRRPAAQRDLAVAVRYLHTEGGTVVSHRFLDEVDATFTRLRSFPTLDALHNDGDILTTLDVLAWQVGIRGIFSDWSATVSYYANCVGLK
jgi:plasmid stabilization system protein ParE